DVERRIRAPPGMGYRHVGLPAQGKRHKPEAFGRPGPERVERTQEIVGRDEIHLNPKRLAGARLQVAQRDPNPQLVTVGGHLSWGNGSGGLMAGKPCSDSRTTSRRSSMVHTFLRPTRVTSMSAMNSSHWVSTSAPSK